MAALELLGCCVDDLDEWEILHSISAFCSLFEVSSLEALGLRALRSQSHVFDTFDELHWGVRASAIHVKQQHNRPEREGVCTWLSVGPRWSWRLAAPRENDGVGMNVKRFQWRPSNEIQSCVDPTRWLSTQDRGWKTRKRWTRCCLYKGFCFWCGKWRNVQFYERTNIRMFGIKLKVEKHGCAVSSRVNSKIDFFSWRFDKIFSLFKCSPLGEPPRLLYKCILGEENKGYCFVFLRIWGCDIMLGVSRGGRSDADVVPPPLVLQNTHKCLHSLPTFKSCNPPIHPSIILHHRSFILKLTSMQFRVSNQP